MNRHLTLILMIIFHLKIQAQNSQTPEAFVVVEQMPEFPGGPSAQMKFLSQNIVLPKAELDREYSGRCYIKFMVDSTGLIRNPEVIKGIPQCPECDREALRVIQLMPRWKPGKQNGKAVNVYYTIPVIFRQQ